MNKIIMLVGLLLGGFAQQGLAVSATTPAGTAHASASMANCDAKRVAYVEVSPDSSLADAVRKARELRRLDKADSVVIKMARGNYSLYEPLVLRPEDSHLCFEGTPSDGGAVGTVINGAVEIKGWRKQGKLWVADVPDFNGRPLDFRHLWVNRTRADKARSVSDYEKMPRIRWVDKKKRVIWVPASAVRPLLTGAKDKQGNSILRADSKYAEMTLHQMWEVSYLRIKSIRLQGDSAAVSFHDPEAKIQFERPWPSPMYNCKHNSPFFISNALPLLDTPGEWYHDIRSGKLYYMPRKDELMPGMAVGDNLRTDNGKVLRATDKHLYVTAPALETLVRFVGTKEKPVDAVTFKNVEFGFTTWMRPSFKGHVPLQAGMYITEGYKLRPSIDRVNNHKLDNQDWLGRPSAAIELSYAHRAVFDECTFDCLGGDGLDFIEGCKDGAVLNCRFDDIAMNGLVCGSFSPEGLETHLPYQPLDPREVCSGLQVKNCEFSDVTHEEWGTCAIALGYVSRTNVEHNYIHDVSYSAISMGWGWNRNFGVMHDNRIHANLIERYAAHMYDCAGIYTLGNQPNTVIFENVVRDICKPSYVHDPKHYFYLYTDEGSSNILLKDNWTSEEKFLKNAYGPNNVWKNNGPSVSEDIVKQAGLLKEGKAEYDPAIPALHKE